MNGKMKSCIKGLQMGCCGNPWPLSPAKKEPIAYSYNGEVLPKLPENELPYAYIDGAPFGRMLWLASAPMHRDGAYGYFGAPDGISWMIYSVNSSGEWDKLDEGNTSIYTSLAILWCNTDVLNADGTLYLAATDPVPVYE